MRLNKIASRIASPLSERHDYGGHISIIVPEGGKYCVRSQNNPDWSGGCYDTREEAERRLAQVEKMKHISI